MSAILVPTPSSCCPQPAHLPLRGRLVRVRVGDLVASRRVHGVCVRCGWACLHDGTAANVDEDLLTLHPLALPVTHARGIIARGTEIPEKYPDLASVEQLTEYGCVQPIGDGSLNNAITQASGQIEIAAFCRRSLGIAAQGQSIEIPAPIAKKIFACDRFVEHALQQARRQDAGHLEYTPLTWRTVTQPVEVWKQRSPDGKKFSYAFIGIYSRLGNDSRTEYIYHVCYALGNGDLNSSFRLSGGAAAFRSQRVGKLLYASYALDLPYNA